MSPATDAENTKSQLVRIPPQMHREVKIEGVHLDLDIGQVLAKAWELWKKKKPQPWRPE
jgi:hypothetical protein